MSPDPQVFRHFDEEAATYADRSAGWLWAPLRRREAKTYMDLLAPSVGERILDAGCGAGHCALLIQQSGAQVHGCDGSPAMVDAAKANGLNASLCNLEEEVPAGGPFEKILCAGVLEFCQRPEAVVLNLAEALSPNGQLVLFLPRLSLLGKIYRRSHRKHGIEINLFTEDDLKKWQSETLRLEEVKRVAFSLAARFSFTSGWSNSPDQRH